MSTKKPALGKGLGALLDASGITKEISSEHKSTFLDDSEGLSTGSAVEMPIRKIEANPFQPRTQFEKSALDELASSIDTHGIIQPITVRRLGKDRYQIIAGERRFRAAEKLGMHAIPTYIRIADDQTMLEMAIVENVQRKDLNAIEVALSYQRLIDECDVTQEQVGERVGKSRASITNYIRLLNLPDAVQVGIRDRAISMGHARALLSFEDNALVLKTYQSIIKDKLSVRRVEELAKQYKDKKPSNSQERNSTISFSSTILERRTQLEERLNTKIQFKGNTNKGKIVINYNDESHLQKIIDSFIKK